MAEEITTNIASYSKKDVAGGLDREEYSIRCSAILDVADRYFMDSIGGDKKASDKSLADLVDLWQGFNPKFDEQQSLGETLNALNAVGSLADEEWTDSVDFFKEFKLQRKDLINANFDYLKSIYLETDNHKLQDEIYKSFVEHIVQSPRDAGKAVEFCLEKYRPDLLEYLEDGKVILITEMMSWGLSAQYGIEDENKLNELHKLAFVKAKDFIEYGSPFLGEKEIEDLIFAIGVTAYSDDGPPVIRLEAQSYLSKQIESLGLSETVLMNVWMQTSTSEAAAISSESFIATNIASMLMLEKQRPGICKTLNEQFNICDFERYPKEVLIAQYDNRDSDLPYGIAVVAQEDHNGAFTQSNDSDHMIDSLYQDSKRLGLSLRIYEADGRGVLNVLSRASERYSDKNKISFVLISQHGAKDKIGVNDENNSTRAITQTHVRRALGSSNNRRMQRFKEMFVLNPTIILDSCSTAQIGEDIASLGAEVIAPKVPTKLGHLSLFEHSSGRVDFAAEYNDEDAVAYIPNPRL